MPLSPVLGEGVSEGVASGQSGGSGRLDVSGTALQVLEQRMPGGRGRLGVCGQEPGGPLAQVNEGRSRWDGGLREGGIVFV